MQIKSTKTLNSDRLRKLLAWRLGLSFCNLGISNILMLDFLFLSKITTSVQQDGLTCLQKSRRSLVPKCVCVCVCVCVSINVYFLYVGTHHHNLQ